MLNPCESLIEEAASCFADEQRLQGVACDTLVNWVRRAIENQLWSEDKTYSLYRQAGMKGMVSTLKIGPGFGCFSWGIPDSSQ